MIPVEKQFQLSDRAIPDFPHHRFVFHMSPDLRIAIPSKSKKVTRILHLCRSGNNARPIDFLRHAIDLRQNRRVANSWTVWTLWCNCGLVPVRAGF
jgi:hypothetical protein